MNSSATMRPMSDSDYELTLKKDPDAFITGLCCNMANAGAIGSDGLLRRQREIFRKWLANYNFAFRDTIAKSVETSSALKMADTMLQVQIEASINALSSLPIRKNWYGREVVDLKKVTQMLKDLKAKRPNATARSN